MKKPQINAFFDKPTNNVSYIVIDSQSRHCAIIDSLLDYDASAGRTNTRSADQIIDFIHQHQLQLDWIIDTHVHADHLSGAQYLKQQLGGRIGIGEHVVKVQAIFKDIFNAGAEFATDGSQFDHLFRNGETYQIGFIEAKVIHTPGHTPACMAHIIGDACFVGDTLFMPDYGTARCDFPGGDARELYRSIQKIYALPDETRIFLCHDYLAPGRDEFAWETTVGEQKASNIHVRAGISEDEFVMLRAARDKTLAMPKLILPAVQVNMRAGNMPPPEDNGNSYLKIPVDVF